MLNLNILKGTALIIAIKKRLNIYKDMMIYDLEQGFEIFINKTWSQDNLPWGYRYYDPILKLVRKNMHMQKKEFYSLKKQLAHDAYTGEFLDKVKEILGFVENNIDGKVNQKYYPVNKKHRKEIDIYHSGNCREVQRSRYIGVDDQIDKPEVCFESHMGGKLHKTGKMLNTGYPRIDKAINLNEANVNIQFKLPRTVQAKKEKMM